MMRCATSQWEMQLQQRGLKPPKKKEESSFNASELEHDCSWQLIGMLESVCYLARE